MPKPIDYTDVKFGLLTAKYFTGVSDKNNGRIWHFICDCGNTCDKPMSSVKSGNVRSCGCKPRNYYSGTDWTKHKFNMLTPIEKTDEYYKNNPTRRVWKLKCDCGNCCKFPMDLVKRGTFISCGCVKKINGNTGKKKKSLTKDYSGQKCNMLTAIYFTGTRNGKSIWLFKCDCGNKIACYPLEVFGNGRDRRKSCGCANKTSAIDYTGQKFNKLTFLYPTNKKCGSMIVWHLLCDCGKECDIAGSSVAKSLTKSCGCLKGQFTGELSTAHDVYTSYQKIERKKFNIDLVISFDQFLILAKANCHYCGREPHRGRKKQRNKIKCGTEFIFNGLDRKDSKLTHTIDNCVSCCWTCNKMKGNMSYNEFIEHNILINNYQNGMQNAKN